MAPITTTFVGRHPTDFGSLPIFPTAPGAPRVSFPSPTPTPIPTPTTTASSTAPPAVPADDAPPPLPSTDAELRVAFVAYLLRVKSDQKFGGSFDQSNLIKSVWACLTALSDPTCQPRQLHLGHWDLQEQSLEEFFSDVFSALLRACGKFEQVWFPPTSASERSAADRRAQRIVPPWYGNYCALTGVSDPDAAHIVPARATQHVSGNVIEIWHALRLFWPLPQLGALSTSGQETTNILPLSPNAHCFWDRFRFALRPLEHPTDPEHRIFVQVVWLADGADQDHHVVGGMVDINRSGTHGHYPGLHHGDTYEITTADPARYPLPSLRLLQIQYGALRIIAGLRGAAALRDIFCGGLPPPPPPPTASASRDETFVPPAWTSLIDEALRAGVIDNESARRWQYTIAHHARRSMRQVGMLVDDDSGDDCDDDVAEVP